MATAETEVIMSEPVQVVATALMSCLAWFCVE